MNDEFSRIHVLYYFYLVNKQQINMSIKENLASTNFPLPAIREVNLAKHKTSISLGLGELRNFPVDQGILNVIQSFAGNEALSYSGNGGYPALRLAIAEQQQLEDGFSYSENHVMVSIGVQNAMYTAIKTLSKLGAKRVLIPEINFGIYKKIPAEFGLDVLTYRLTNDFGIDLSYLGSILKPDDIVVINSPSNPTGRVLEKKELEQLGLLFTEKLTDGFVISDEIYSQLVYEGDKPPSLSAYFGNTIVANGISKSGAVAGLRVGWLIAQNEQLIQAFISNNATIISCPPTLNQMAAVPIVKGQTVNTIMRYCQQLKTNRDLVCLTLDELKIKYVKPKGSFYIFPNIASVVGDETKAFCINTAKKENGVVVIPGDAFGAPGYVRISLASDEIAEGMKRFKQAIEEELNKT